jgi:hypothetical protein
MESVLYDVAGHRRSPATMPGFHRGARRRTRVCATRLTRQRSKRSWRSWVPQGMAPMVRGCERSLSFCGEPVYGLVRRSSWPRRTSIARAVRCSFGAAKEAVAERSAWTGGRGPSSSRGWKFAVGSRLGRCCASSTVRPAAGIWSNPPPANNFAELLRRRGCGAGSLRISYAMRTPLRWRMKASRWSSSSASSGTRTSGSRRSICKASTARRSSPPSTHAALR